MKIENIKRSTMLLYIAKKGSVALDEDEDTEGAPANYSRQEPGTRGIVAEPQCSRILGSQELF